MVYLSLGPHTRKHMIGCWSLFCVCRAMQVVDYYGGLTQFVYLPPMHMTKGVREALLPTDKVTTGQLGHANKGVV